MRRPLCLLLSALAAGMVLGAPGAAEAAERTGRALVLLEKRDDERAQASAARALLSRAGLRRTGPSLPQIGLVTVDAPPPHLYDAWAERLRRDPAVSAVQLEHRAELRERPNDPALVTPEPRSTGIPLQWALERQGLYHAWDVTTGDGVVVAVIDTGIDGTHPDLQGKIAGAIDLSQEGGPATADENGHGTHVSSLACAAANNGYGIAGAGFNCRLLVVKSDLSDASIAASITAAADAGADAINMSFGEDAVPPPGPIVRAVDYAVAKGVLLVAAANQSNSGPPEEQGWPASLLQPNGTGPDIDAGRGLSVTAANVRNERASFAGRGSQISLAAYGAWEGAGGPPGIFGAFPGGTVELEQSTIVPPSSPCGCRATLNGDDRYAYLQGTSMAAPQVAAIGAMVGDLNPDLDLREVIRVVKASARRPAGSAWSPDLGWGIVDASAAVESARAIDRRPPSARVRGPRTVRIDRTFTLRWSGKDSRLPGLRPSGIARYDVYRSKNGSRYRRFKSTRANRMRYKAQPGARYRFYVRAVDRAGNREAVPRRADLATRVSRNAR